MKRRNGARREMAAFLAGLLLLSQTGCRSLVSLESGSPAEEETDASPSGQLPGEDVSVSEAPEQTDAPADDPAEQSPDPGPVEDPVEDPAEDPVEEPEDGDFVRILDYIPTARVELAYATENNFTGCRIYDFTEAYLRYGTVKKLMEVSRELEELGIGLIIWDAFRPVSAQAKLWEICPDPTYVSHPVTGRRAHCRGNAVDVSLYDLRTGEYLPVPTGFDDFTACADRDYSDCSEEAAANAVLLEKTMEKYGFTAYFAEWWHFSDSEEQPVEEDFDPAEQ